LLSLETLRNRYENDGSLIDHRVDYKNRKHHSHDRAKTKAKITFVSGSFLHGLLGVVLCLAEE
jgi:hypothetical protein